MRPRLKPLHMSREGGAVRLLREPGVYFDLEDENGQVMALLQLLTGDHTVSQVHRALVTDWPELTEQDIADAVKALDAHDLLVDADAEAVARQPELDRYASNLAFLSTFATLDVSSAQMHERLRDAHVVLLGVGGLGVDAAAESRGGPVSAG
jgi:molybdopterin-synthase adenylyltransferase